MAENFSAIQQLFKVDKIPFSRRNPANVGIWVQTEERLENSEAFLNGKGATRRIVNGVHRRYFKHRIPSGQKWPTLGMDDFVGAPGTHLTIETLKVEWSPYKAQAAEKSVVVDTGQRSAYRGTNVHYLGSQNNGPG